MKSRYLFSVVCLFSASQAVAQTDSPYARFGYEGKVLRTPQERQQRMMLLVPNTDTTSAVAQVGLDPANQRYYLFGKQNQVLQTDTLNSTEVARFLSVDPLAANYAYYSPYMFAGNTPIQALDLDGLEILSYRANFALNQTKTILGVVYFGKANQNLGYFSKNSMPLNSIGVANQMRGIVYKDEPTSRVSPAPTIWSDDRVDIGPADKLGDKFEDFNKNSKPNQAGAVADAIQFVAKLAYDGINSEKNDAYKELSQQRDALKTAFGLADNSIQNSTKPWDMKHDYKFFKVSIEQYRTDLTNYIFDGSLPKSDNKQYKDYLESRGQVILKSSKTEQNKERISK